MNQSCFKSPVCSFQHSHLVWLCCLLCFFQQWYFYIMACLLNIFIYLLIFCLYYFFSVLFIYLLYNIVLVLPYLDMNPPWVYMCSHPEPPHLPPHPTPLFWEPQWHTGQKELCSQALGEVGWEARVSPVTRAQSFKAGPVGCELHKCVQGFTLLRWDWIAQGAVDGDCPSPGQWGSDDTQQV